MWLGGRLLWGTATLSGPPRQSYELFDSPEDLSLERSMAREAAVVAWCLAIAGSKGSEGIEEGRLLRMERADLVLLRRSFVNVAEIILENYDVE